MSNHCLCRRRPADRGGGSCSENVAHGQRFAGRPDALTRATACRPEALEPFHRWSQSKRWNRRREALEQFQQLQKAERGRIVG
jgi:hypothetical protein